MDDKTASQAEMFFNRLVKRRRHLAKWARRTGVSAYRLYSRDIPEVPLALDWYGPPPASAESPAAVLSFYKRPYEKEEAEETAWQRAMEEAAASALGLSPAEIFSRERKRQRGGGQYEKQSCPAVRREIFEHGLLYEVNLSAYLDTGFFLDRRLFRALIRSESEGKNVLNLFAYTGSISVAAAAGGAASVDSVDLSPSYLAWARRNFLLNKLDRENCSFIRSDVLRFTADAARERKTWETVILDPPAFSNSKKMSADFDLKRDHPMLAARCIKLLKPGGTLYLSANVKGFTLKKEELEQALGRIGRRIAVEDITQTLRDEDYKEKRIPAAYRVRC